MTPDSTRVLYEVSGDIWGVPVAGGAATQISPVLPANKNVTLFSVTPDSASLVYRVDDSTGNWELYSTPITGGPSAWLSQGPPQMNSLRFSPDSTRLVYHADQDTDQLFELYSAGVVADPDGDGIDSFCDLCPTSQDPGQEDFDADELGDACDPDDDNDSFLDASDCLDTNASVWAIPDEVRDLLFDFGSQTVSWIAPLAPGSVSVLYDTLRSTVPQDFLAFGVCAETDGADTSFIETAVPPVGTFFSYLVRAVNACGDGSLGTNSNGTPRQGVSCP